jgi:hypothetical protein
MYGRALQINALSKELAIQNFGPPEFWPDKIAAARKKKAESQTVHSLPFSLCRLT